MITPETTPAFPSHAIEGATDERSEQRDGMSLRDYFAAHCPSDIAVIREPEAVALLVGPQPEHSDTRAMIVWTMAVEALLRYAYADAMLKARQK